MSFSDCLFKQMEKNFEKIICTEKFSSANSGDSIKTDEKALVTFAVWGDPQVSFISPLRSARVYKAVEDIRKGDKLDALVLCGDITEYGAKCEYKFVKKLLDNLGGKCEKIFAVPGNHDVRLRNFKKQVKRFTQFVNSVNNGDADDNSYYYKRDINGYRFIMMGTDRCTFEASYINANQLKRLEEDIISAPKNKPVFVFNHQALKHTNGLPVTFLGKGKWRGSVGRESEKLRKVLEKRPNVFYITGHLHYGTSQYTFENLGNIKALSVPTVGVINHGKFNTMTQGYLISVYDDKVTLRSRIFGESKYTPNTVSNAFIEVPIDL